MQLCTASLEKTCCTVTSHMLQLGAAGSSCTISVSSAHESLPHMTELCLDIASLMQVHKQQMLSGFRSLTCILCHCKLSTCYLLTLVTKEPSCKKALSVHHTSLMPPMLVQDGVSIQELSVASTASPAVSDAKPEAKQVASKPIKQEDGKPEMVGPAVSNIPADALNRLIAMGGPAGERMLTTVLTHCDPQHVPPCSPARWHTHLLDSCY